MGPVAENDDADGDQDFIVQLDDVDTSDNVDSGPSNNNDNRGEPIVAQATSIPTVAPPSVGLTINVNASNNNITVNSNCVINNNYNNNRESHVRVRKGNSMLGSVKKGKYSI